MSDKMNKEDLEAAWTFLGKESEREKMRVLLVKQLFAHIEVLQTEIVTLQAKADALQTDIDHLTEHYT